MNTLQAIEILVDQTNRQLDVYKERFDNIGLSQASMAILAVKVSLSKSALEIVKAIQSEAS